MVLHRIILPDTSSLTFDNLVGTDPACYAGLEGGVYRHGNRLLVGAALTTLFRRGSRTGRAGESPGRQPHRHRWPGRAAGLRESGWVGTDPTEPQCAIQLDGPARAAGAHRRQSRSGAAAVPGHPRGVHGPGSRVSMEGLIEACPCNMFGGSVAATMFKCSRTEYEQNCWLWACRPAPWRFIALPVEEFGRSFQKYSAPPI
ncbi:hypothetical protein [Xanthomonas sp. LMG 8992]|uniref:hypothetical protein n=1 Tax=Xanthomonas sp. LMG 8992 TaxID=1591157 RepID=UPI0034E08204